MGTLGLKKSILVLLIILILIPLFPLNIEDWHQSANRQNNFISMKIATTPSIDLSKLPEINYSALNALWNEQRYSEN